MRGPRYMHLQDAMADRRSGRVVFVSHCLLNQPSCGVRTTLDLPSAATASWAEIRGAVTFEPVGDATRMRWAWDVHPKGLANVLTPLVGVVGRRQERACWQGLKEYLEAAKPGVRDAPPLP